MFNSFLPVLWIGWVGKLEELGNGWVQKMAVMSELGSQNILLY